jgi:uncharacterized protein YbjQ (UPF0145 family)
MVMAIARRYRPGMTSDGAACVRVPITTAFELPGARVVHNRGTCFGLVVRSMGFAKGVSAAVKTLRQGEVSQYTELLEDSRRHAIDRMVDNARLLGANAIIGMRFDSSEIGNSLTEVVAYGTGVVVEHGADDDGPVTSRSSARSWRRCVATSPPDASTSSSSTSERRSCTGRTPASGHGRRSKVFRCWTRASRVRVVPGADVGRVKPCSSTGSPPTRCSETRPAVG